MKTKVNITLAASVTLIALAAAIWFAIPYCIKEYSTSNDIGPRAFPRLMCILIVILSAIQLILVLTGLQKGKFVEVDFRGNFRVPCAMALALAAVVMALYVNLIAAGVIVALLMLLLLKVRSWKYYLAVCITGIMLFILMKYIMHMRF